MIDIYEKLLLKDIPWNFETPPDVLKALVNDGKILPCEAIDLGCGAGNYAIYLAQSGFDVTGIDISPAAIKLAVDNARNRNVKCRFIAGDLTGKLNDLYGRFAFAFEWKLLHHIFPEQRKGYVENVHKLLTPGGVYLSLCFHEDDPNFSSTGKYRKTPLGTTLYFSSQDELKKLFEPLFNILALKTIEINGNPAPHVAHYVLMKKAIAS